MAIIKPQQITSTKEKSSKRQLYATVCYFYPQYTLQQVRDMPNRDVRLLLETAYKVQAKDMYSLTQIVAAPHTAGGKSVGKLLEHFKKIGKF